VLAQRVHSPFLTLNAESGEKMGENNWRELCEQIMKENDPEKLMELVEQLNQALEAREEELRNIARRNLPKASCRAGT
jgi:hypothetical protein